MVKLQDEPLMNTEPGSNFLIGEGRQSGSGMQPRCRGCKTSLKADTLRIIAKGAFYTVHKISPIPVKYHICLNPDCLQKAVTQGKKSKSGIIFPAFNGVLNIAKKLEGRLPCEVQDRFQQVNISFRTTEMNC